MERVLVTMAENAALKYKVYNPEKKDCPVSSLFNSLYKADAFQSEQRIPREAGKGYCQRYILNPSMEIFVSDSTFYEDITMREEVHAAPIYGLAFCLEDPFRWQMDGSNREYEIGCGESYIFDGVYGNNSCTYCAGKRFLGLSLRYDRDAVAGITAHMGKGYAPAAPGYDGSRFYTRKFSPNIRLILHDILHCRYRGDIKKIYLEGKALELLAVYLDELILENGKSDALPKLSSSDIDALHYARKLLDGNIVSPPTIGRLSRLVCLNEYKLKAGFRELFGMPVHAYIIDKRLELGRLLMTERKLNVAEAALLVGYSNTNYFTKKFTAKYGIKPSEYRKPLQASPARNPF